MNRDMTRAEVIWRAQAGGGGQADPPVSSSAKDAMREEIARKVEVYLQAGGTIDRSAIIERSHQELSEAAVRTHLKLNQAQYRNYVEKIHNAKRYTPRRGD